MKDVSAIVEREFLELPRDVRNCIEATNEQEFQRERPYCIIKYNCPLKHYSEGASGYVCLGAWLQLNVIRRSLRY